MSFSNFDGMQRIVMIAIFSYASLVIFLRVSGKRTLSKLNAFDLVITMAMGTTLATTILNSNVTWVKGITAFLVLIALQYLVAKLTVRLPWFEKIIKSEPQVLFKDGEFKEEAMEKERVPKSAILQAMRSQGLGSMKQVKEVFLESDGSISVIKQYEE
ncbi:YetF domain-containing protein [Rossellomorea oryzaecorticis]|uniref:YetF domain-containing protein n=1 Tax=Rossellomorea oryzaecorticis TaxID=1396505 RepID=A0ABU9K9F2_9BACI